MLFDTHSHLDDEKFDADRDELIQKIHEEDGVGLMMCVGADMESSRRAIKLTLFTLLLAFTRMTRKT